MGKLIQPKNNFTVVSNYILREKTISLKTKGLYTIMRALPDGWNFSIAGLMTLSSDGKEATQNAVWEMEEHGYLKRRKFQNEQGFFDYEYELFHKPPTNFTKPVTDFPSKDNPPTENPSYNKELSNQELKDKGNTATGKQSPAPATKPLKKTTVFKSSHADIAEVIKAMESVDKKNKLYYGNTTQKGAVDFLLVEYGKEHVLQLIGALPQLRTKVSYFPSITTPCELRDKWVKAFEALNREKQGNKVGKVKVEMV